jgi:hypothetical protein
MTKKIRKYFRHVCSIEGCQAEMHVLTCADEFSFCDAAVTLLHVVTQSVASRVRLSALRVDLMKPFRP